MAEPSKWEKELQSALARMQEAITRGQPSHGKLLEALVLTAGQQALSHVQDRIRRKEERRLRREEDRRRRKAEREEASAPVGIVFGGSAAVALYYALTQPGLWWMFFLAFGLSVASASILGARLAPQEGGR
jgi:hypothetical protein